MVQSSWTQKPNKNGLWNSEKWRNRGFLDRGNYGFIWIPKEVAPWLSEMGTPLKWPKINGSLWWNSFTSMFVELFWTYFTSFLGLTFVAGNIRYFTTSWGSLGFQNVIHRQEDFFERAETWEKYRRLGGWAMTNKNTLPETNGKSTWK